MGAVSNDLSGWKLSKIVDGSLSCENPNLNENDISTVMKTVQSKFGERMKEENVFVSYDNWSGVYFMAIPGKSTQKSDKLIKDIYEFLIEQE
jgi:hypothetical protein